MRETHANTPSPKRRQTPTLERTKVLDATLDLLNESGFDGLTLRNVAAKLGVKAAALYWHFENKQDLINQVAGRIFAREFEADEADFVRATWREILTNMGHGMCDTLLRYRDGALLLASADMSKAYAGFKGRELVIKSLLSKGIPEPIIFTAMFTIVRYTLGYVFEEQTDPQSKKKASTYIQHSAAYLRDLYPEATDELIRIHAHQAKNPRYQFEQGLELILDGIERKLTA